MLNLTIRAYPFQHFRFGSDEVKRQFLAPTIAGDLVSCIGVSEVGGGSDVASECTSEPVPVSSNLT